MKVVKLADGSFSAAATIAPGAPGAATIVLAGRDTWAMPTARSCG